MIKCLGSGVIAFLSVLAVASPAMADTPPQVKVTIEGPAVVGATLQAVVEVTGAPLPTVTYQWQRCDPSGGGCDAIKDAKSATYIVVSADVGHRLIVRVTPTGSKGDKVPSDPTDVITASPDPPPPSPPPASPPPTNPPPTSGTTPAPTPAPVNFAPAPSSPVVGVGAPGTGSATTPLTPVFPAAPYLRPFPVVRIKGASVAGGALIELLRVTAPRTAEVNVRCVGKRCPLRRLVQRSGRIRALERFLPTGLAITIRVTRPGYIGKYVRFIVRSRAAPERHDACLLPTSSRPKRCPA
ncbi:MAG: hypothetical protein ACJ77Z_10375 [Thermoleophilaceae bacterium]